VGGQWADGPRSTGMDGRSHRFRNRIDPADLPAPDTSRVEDSNPGQVVAGPDGFVITGTRPPGCELFAWHSGDGRNWTESSVPEGCGGMTVAPAGGTGWVAVVTSIDPGVVVLESADGRTWITVDGETPKADNYSSPTSLTTRGDMLVLSGGSRPADSDESTPVLWTSRDGGVTWAETTLGDQQDGETIVAGFPTTVNDLGFVGSNILQPKDGPAPTQVLFPGSLVFSPDGSSWSEIPANDVFFDFAASGDSIIATTTGGILSWTPTGSELARTGAADTTALLLVASILVTVGVALRFTHRVRRTRAA
jgi:hypothetical protein